MSARFLLQEQAGIPAVPGQSCDDPDTLWGLPGGAAAFIFILVGFVIGTLTGAGAAYFLQRRAIKAARHTPASGGWRISAALTGRPDSYDADGQSKGHRTKESLDDATFANILTKTMALLGASQVSNMQSRQRKETGQTPLRSGAVLQQPTFEGQSLGAKEADRHDSSNIHDSVQSSSIPNNTANDAKEVQDAAVVIVHEPPRGGCSHIEDDDGSSIDSEYDLDDLDDEWVHLLQKIDERLIDGGKPSMESRERAVAIRSLLGTSSTETHDEALERAIRDVLASRV
mmetsp:Transcript_21796/g.60570  ORF Transcript_21796/g.60570 Transcript_21796/m.60570 type:complete len:286 (-) Transcript_21796:328-1185(-)|eukprot:CAMPEP_0117655676 /NCGR_PEP_ID=MMETSP0804-20121206/4405_1 /TAXON_ID=1074897 /ORGANISM="Tetraselmis astigmatica, Strain CCMP880" /LENGTH=285 /DNA_ID=CAMNT_0005462041 /DNA_START=312 /DNA_END=1169 /DNA_ORIENTATION=+